MRQYISIFKIRLLRGLQYRTAALAGIATQFFWGFILIVILQAFAAAAPESSPMSVRQIASYIWLQQAFLAFIMLWFRDPELLAIITRGDTAYELTRPIDLYAYWYARLIGQRLAAAFLRCLPILLVAFLLPEPFGMSLPASPLAFVLFLITLTIGVFVVVGISMTIYILATATLSPQAAFLLVGPIGEFCGGLIIPLPMMPDWMRRTFEFLPFRLSTDLPLRIYSGLIGPMDALKGIGLQVFWIFILIAGGRAAMSAVLRRASFPGA